MYTGKQSEKFAFCYIKKTLQQLMKIIGVGLYFEIIKPKWTRIANPVSIRLNMFEDHFSLDWTSRNVLETLQIITLKDCGNSLNDQLDNNKVLDIAIV